MRYYSNTKAAITNIITLLEFILLICWVGAWLLFLVSGDRTLWEYF
jgi:hypothetical protein